MVGSKLVLLRRLLSLRNIHHAANSDNPLLRPFSARSNLRPTPPKNNCILFYAVPSNRWQKNETWDRLNNAADLNIIFHNKIAFIKNQNGITFIPGLVEAGEAMVDNMDALEIYFDIFQYPGMDVLIEFPPQ